MRVGYFGSSTGAAAALMAAARLGDEIGAVVSRGGRPDLAGDALPLVKAPTLLIVGGHDETVIELNQDAYARLRCERVEGHSWRDASVRRARRARTGRRLRGRLAQRASATAPRPKESQAAHRNNIGAN